jgi:sugar phosphate isomerase/epimerase
MGVPGETPFLPTDTALMRATKTALQETGVQVLDVELARILPDIDPKSYAPAMEAAAEMGARHVISSAWTKDQNDGNFLVERYSEICDLAASFGLTVDLEFPTFSRLTNIREASDIVRASARPNGGILIDTLYFHFSRAALADLKAVPKQWVHFMHICDAPEAIPDSVEGMKHIAREARLYVGEGCIDFAGILAEFPNVPLSIELPNEERVKELGYAGYAARCLETAKAALNGDSGTHRTGRAA